MVLCVLLTAASPAGATISNGGFDTPLPPYWTAVGDYAIDTGTYGPAGDPTLVLTSNPSPVGPSVPPLGTGAVAADPDVIALLGISAATLEANDPPGVDAFEGSGVVQTFNTGAVAPLLSFTWQLFTNETLFANPYPDFILVTVRNQAGTYSSTQMLTDVATEDGAGNFVASSTPYDSELPVSVFNLLLPGPDVYTVGVALFDVEDNQYDSALALDDFQVVPEPGAHALLAGAFLLALARARRRS